MREFNRSGKFWAYIDDIHEQVFKKTGVLK